MLNPITRPIICSDDQDYVVWKIDHSAKLGLRYQTLEQSKKGKTAPPPRLGVNQHNLRMQKSVFYFTKIRKLYEKCVSQIICF